jgi:hypothetical protein
MLYTVGPVDGGNIFLLNFDTHLQDCTVSNIEDFTTAPSSVLATTASLGEI